MPTRRTSRARTTGTTGSISTGIRSRGTRTTTQAWLREWVYELDGRGDYLEKLGADRVASLRPGSAPSGSVDYGAYR